MDTGVKGTRETEKAIFRVNHRPDDKILINEANACFVRRKVDCNCTVAKFLCLQCGQWVDLWHDLNLNGLFTACSRSKGKKILGLD